MPKTIATRISGSELRSIPGEMTKVSLFLLPFFLGCFFSAALSAEEELESYRAAMGQLAEECHRSGLELEAKVTQNRIWADPENGFFVPRLPERRQSELPEDACQAQREWFEKLRRIETEYGARLFAQAQKLAEAGKGREAYAAARTSLFIDPENEEVRRIFGYHLYGGVWQRQWEHLQLKKGLVKDPQYGWVSAKQKEDLDGGSEETGKSRPKKREKTTLETEHFEIKTTVSRSIAVPLAERLEEFYAVWNFLFFPIMVSEKEAAAVVLGKKEYLGEKHKVVLFRDRDEYLREILKVDPHGQISSGGYIPGKKTVYLYLPEESNEDETPLEVMAVHETAHQLFAETGMKRRSARRRIDPGENGGYWIVEGIASYLETFQVTGRGSTVGGTHSYRLQRAKERADEPDGLLPIAELAGMGKKRFQQDPFPAKLYTESTGLVSFFLHAGGGKYREAFLDTLGALYQGIDTPGFLEERIGVPYSLLVPEFLDYLRKTPFTE